MPPPEQKPLDGTPEASAARAMLAPRAAAALQPALSYGAAFGSLKERGLWAPDNPDGSIVLGVAENRISSELVHVRVG